MSTMSPLYYRLTQYEQSRRELRILGDPYGLVAAADALAAELRASLYPQEQP